MYKTSNIHFYPHTNSLNSMALTKLGSGLFIALSSTFFICFPDVQYITNARYLLVEIEDQGPTVPTTEKGKLLAPLKRNTVEVKLVFIYY